MTDNSYKLFAAAPTPGTDIRRSIDGGSGSSVGERKPKSDTELAAAVKHADPAAVAAALAAEKEANPALRGSPAERHSSKGSHHSTATTVQPGIERKPTVNGGIEPVVKKPEVIKGPWRLLRLLPRETRHIIGRMLEIDPRKRATMAEILDDPWVANTIICRQDVESGKVVPGPAHTHTLEPPSSQPPAK